MNGILIPIVIAIIPALAAVLSPIITNCMNNHFQIKMTKIDVVYKTKLTILENLMDSFGKVFNSQSPTHKEDFISNISKAILVTNGDCRNYLLHILDLLKDFDWDKAYQVFITDIKLLSDEIYLTRSKIIKYKDH